MYAILKQKYANRLSTIVKLLNYILRFTHVHSNFPRSTIVATEEAPKLNKISQIPLHTLNGLLEIPTFIQINCLL